MSIPATSSTAIEIHGEDDVKKWAYKLGETPTALYNRMKAQVARMDDADFKMVLRNTKFEDFQGVTFADAKILNLFPSRFNTRPVVPGNAYKISPVAGKGLGMFAAKDIPAGAVVLSENPVIVFPSVMGLGMSVSREEIFKMMFDRLAPDVRARALSLKNSKPAHVCGKEEGILRTNGMGLDLAAPKIANPPATGHSGTFMDLSRCNHR
jgi:hypothetical protein